MEAMEDHELLQNPPIPKINWQNLLLLNKALILFIDIIAITGLYLTNSFFGIGICMFISILTLIFISLIVGIVASQWHFDILSTKMFNDIIPHSRIEWKHVQYLYSIIFGCFNFYSFMILAFAANDGHRVFFPGVSTLLIIFFFVIEGCLALRLSSFEPKDDYLQI
uniref:Transmembrane protein n=1 Tax=Panagrolaimus sp. PS1159 TaxID=55785 RepID=A0AC35G3Y0_9BILA